MIQQTTLKGAGMRLLVVAVVVVTVLGTVSAGVAASPPSPPHRFFGTVSDTGGDAVEGMTVEVVHDGTVVASDTTDADGYYDLKVEGLSDGDEVTIRVNGTETSARHTWESGGSTQQDFTVNVTPSVVASESDDIPADDTVTVDLPDVPGRVVPEVWFGFAEGTTGRVTVEQLSGSPAGVPDLPDPVAVYLNITAPDTSQSTTLRVTIEKSAITNAGLSADGVVIAHYTDDGFWTKLDTAIVNETSSTVTLEADVTGFSPYAVTQGNPSDETGGDGTTTSTTGTTTTDGTTTTTTDGGSGDGGSGDGGSGDGGTGDGGTGDGGTGDGGTSDGGTGGSETTQQPTTEQPTTEQPTTQQPTSQQPTTEQPPTSGPTTEGPTSQQPTTEEPTDTTAGGTTSTSADTTSDDTTGGFIPGFTGVTAVIAVLGSLLLLRRRDD